MSITPKFRSHINGSHFTGEIRNNYRHLYGNYQCKICKKKLKNLDVFVIHLGWTHGISMKLYNGEPIPEFELEPEPNISEKESKNCKKNSGASEKMVESEHLPQINFTFHDEKRQYHTDEKIGMYSM